MKGHLNGPEPGMRVGIAMPFAYRPHVAHMMFLGRQLERLGYSLFYLGCGGALSSCHSKVARRGLRRTLECAKCRIGGLTSYVAAPVARLDRPLEVDAADVEQARAFVYSTVCSTLQVEHPRESRQEEFRRLETASAQAAAVAYRNTQCWIRDNRIESVFVFNGRFDLTRAVIEACTAESVRFVSVERSWFGDGLQLLPGENCLGLRNIHEFSSRWAGRPLSRVQALAASELITRRVTRQSVGEWKQYNVGYTGRHAAGDVKYLFLPSSQHEWMGHPDRRSGWPHPTDGVEFLFRHLGLKFSDLVVRGHPAWALKNKLYGSSRTDEFYRQWSARVGARFIPATSKVDTHELMRDAGLIMLNGSSASMEAAWLGKPLISFVPAAFTRAGISLNLFDEAAVVGMNEATVAGLVSPERPSVVPATQCRLALRYLYCANFRLMQFVGSLRSTSPFEFRATDPMDLGALRTLAEEGTLQESDTRFDADESAESAVIDAILAGNAHTLRNEARIRDTGEVTPIRRRAAYRLIDAVTK
jgi:hypothetical protein